MDSLITINCFRVESSLRDSHKQTNKQTNKQTDRNRKKYNKNKKVRKYKQMQWNLPERPPSQNRDWFLRQIAISETSHKWPPNQNPDWFLSQIAISETSRKRPPPVSLTSKVVAYRIFNCKGNCDLNNNYSRREAPSLLRNFKKWAQFVFCRFFFF